MGRYQHNSGNIQQFTDVCLDCGRNINISDEEYEKSLIQEINSLRSKVREKRLYDLEEEKKKLQDILYKKDEFDYDDRF